MSLAAEGRDLIDFGLRRAHGAEAGLLAARASYIGGFAGTATTPAAELWRIPVFGTMAHSFVQAHHRERDAFLNFARSRPDNLVLLIDTYDTERGAEKVADLARMLESEGIIVRGVRLDSGDLGAHAKAVRAILDRSGLQAISIFASGGLDEHKIAELVTSGAPIDGFAVGSNLATSQDAPALDCAYKLQEYAGDPKRKRSEGKATWPGRKQVYRRFVAGGTMLQDTLSLDESDVSDGTPPIRPFVRAGKPVSDPTTLDEIRNRCAKQLACLPPPLRRLESGHAYPVEVSPALRELVMKLDREPD